MNENTVKNQFEQGTIVKLKSGGPPMTVDSTRTGHGGGRVHTSWFEGTHLNQGDFGVDSLVKTAKP